MGNITKRCLTKHVYCYKYFPEAAARRCSSKQKFKKKKKKKSRKFQRKTPVLESLSKKVVGFKAQVFQ